MKPNDQEPDKDSAARAFADYLDIVDKIVDTQVTNEDIEGRLRKLLRRSAPDTKQPHELATPELHGGGEVRPLDRDTSELSRRHLVARRTRRRARSADRLVTYSAKLLPGTKQLRWAEEFHAVLEELEETGASRGTQLAFSLGFLGFALRMRFTFHAGPKKRAVVERKLAEYRKAFQ
jgi:hypothetical protein